MKKMNKMRKAVVGGLVGLVIGLGGCANHRAMYERGEISYEDYQRSEERDNAAMTSLLGGLLGGLGARRGDAGAVVLGQAISHHGAAQAGRSEVNVYNSPSQQEARQVYVAPQPVAEPTTRAENGPHIIYNEKFDELVVGTFNYAMDLDNNGFVHYPDEYKGIKDYFTAEEKITVSLGSQNLIPDLSFKLINQSGDITDSFSIKDRGVNESYGINMVYNSGSDADGNGTLASGDYHALWYSGGELLAQWQFSVKEK